MPWRARENKTSEDTILGGSQNHKYQSTDLHSIAPDRRAFSASPACGVPICSPEKERSSPARGKELLTLTEPFCVTESFKEKINICCSNYIPFDSIETH